MATHPRYNWAQYTTGQAHAWDEMVPCDTMKVVTVDADAPESTRMRRRLSPWGRMDLKWATYDEKKG